MAPKTFQINVLEVVNVLLGFDSKYDSTSLSSLALWDVVIA